MALAILPWAEVPPPPPRPPQDWQFPILKAALPLLVALLVGALVLYFVDRWRKRPPSASLEANDQLTHFRSLYERGEMTREEYERVKGLLTGELRRELNVPAPPPAPPTGDSPPAPPSAS
jgi:hypothetical protein